MGSSNKQPPMNPSEFYGHSEGAVCTGTEQCHFCLAPCTRSWLHKEPPPLPFVKQTKTAKKPESPWMCVACWLWRRRRTTVYLFSGGYQDGKCLLDFSTLCLPDKCLVVDLPGCKDSLYETLLCPPLEFSLSLLEGEGQKNLLQLQIVNSHREIKADTELHFTVNNIPHSYTVHELEETLILGDNGRMPGARAIYKMLGPFPKGQEEVEVKKIRAKRGRPTLEEQAERNIDPRDGKHDRVIKGAKNP